MRALRCVLVLATSVAVLQLASREAKASPQARLVYSRGAGAESCADEAGLRRAVAARIGYDPFFPWAPRTIIATIAAKGERLVARVELVGEEAKSEGARELEGSGLECGPLIDTVALTISIAIDPHALARPATPPDASTPAPRPSPAPSPPESRAPEPPPKDASAPAPASLDASGQPRVQLAFDLRTSFGTEPAIAPGAAIGAALAWRSASLGIEAATDLAATADAPGGGSVRGWLASASLVPCVRFGPGRACGLASVGRFEGSASGVPSPETHAAPFVAFGGRAGVEVPLFARVALLAHADLLINADPATLRVGPSDVWTAPRLAGSLGAGLGADL